MTDPATLLAGYLEAGDGRELDRLARLIDEHVVVHAPGGRTTRGADAVIASWLAAHAGLSGLCHTVQDIVAAGSMAAARIRVAGRHQGSFLGISPTGNDIAVDGAIFVSTGSDRILEIWEIVDTGHGLRQLGLLDDQPLGP